MPRALLGFSLTVTAVRGMALEDVVARFGIAATSLTQMPLEDALEQALIDLTRPWLILEQRGDVILAWEECTVEGSRPEVLAALTSQGGEALSVHDNPSWGSHGFVYAVDGVVIAWASSLVPDPHFRGEDPERLLPEIRRAGIVADQVRSQECVHLLENMFGVKLIFDNEQDEVTTTVITPYPPPQPQLSHPVPPGLQSRPLAPRPPKTPRSPKMQKQNQPVRGTAKAVRLKPQPEFAPQPEED